MNNDQPDCSSNCAGMNVSVRDSQEEKLKYNDCVPFLIQTLFFRSCVAFKAACKYQAAVSTRAAQVCTRLPVEGAVAPLV